MFSFIEQLRTELKQLEFLIGEIDKMDLSRYDGTLVYDLSRGQLKYSLRQRKNGVLDKRLPLGGADDPRVQRIKIAKYYRKMREVLLKNRKLLGNIIDKYKNYNPDAIGEMLPYAYRDLPPACYGDPRYQELVKWVEAPYEKNGRAFTSSKCTTVDRKIVRSKAEAIIYNMLLYYGIPFRYEQKKELLNVESGYKEVRYPDFTILLADGQELHWEHFGLMEQDYYFDVFCKKMRLYYRNDLTVGDNLIITMDDQHGGINTFMIERIIQGIILPQVRRVTG